VWPASCANPTRPGRLARPSSRAPRASGYQERAAPGSSHCNCRFGTVGQGALTRRRVHGRYLPCGRADRILTARLQKSTKDRSLADTAATRDDRRSGIQRSVISHNSTEIRCTGCARLLAKLCGGRLVIQRGELQATFDGQFRASLVCSQPRCRRLNLVDVRSHEGREDGFSK
jgi:phage FluMu protein Com